jgi:hypothetical protein
VVQVVEDISSLTNGDDWGKGDAAALTRRYNPQFILNACESEPNP